MDPHVHAKRLTLEPRSKRSTAFNVETHANKTCCLLCPWSRSVGGVRRRGAGSVGEGWRKLWGFDKLVCIHNNQLRGEKKKSYGMGMHDVRKSCDGNYTVNVAMTISGAVRVFIFLSYFSNPYISYSMWPLAILAVPVVPGVISRCCETLSYTR